MLNGEGLFSSGMLHAQLLGQGMRVGRLRRKLRLVRRNSHLLERRVRRVRRRPMRHWRELLDLPVGLHLQCVVRLLFGLLLHSQLLRNAVRIQRLWWELWLVLGRQGLQMRRRVPCAESAMPVS
jgi:hypothetical protein